MSTPTEKRKLDERAELGKQIAVAVEAEQAELAAPVAGQARQDDWPESARRPLFVENPDAFQGLRYTERPAAYSWLLNYSLRRACLGVIAGPPGAGKGVFSIQFAAAVAAGVPILGIWKVTEPGRVIYLSAEDDEQVIHRRFYHALELLPKERRELAAKNFYGIPVHGNVTVSPGSTNLEDLRQLISSVRPSLVFVDTYARFAGIEENKTAETQAFCGMFEDIIHDYGCNIIFLHHTNKVSGDCVDNEKELNNALLQSALRGSSVLAGCARWALLMAPLGADLAEKRVAGAGDKADGSYLAVRVAKKNAGSPERRHFLGRDDNGMLHREDAVPQEKGGVVEDAHTLAEEVRRREHAGESKLSVSRGGQDAFGWGINRTKNAVGRGLSLRLFSKSKEGRGGHLCSNVPDVPI
jgi:hypothetical protein